MCREAWWNEGWTNFKMSRSSIKAMQGSPTQTSLKQQWLHSSTVSGETGLSHGTYYVSYVICHMLEIACCTNKNIQKGRTSQNFVE